MTKNNLFTLLTLITMALLNACDPNNNHDLKKACIDVNVVRDGKLITVDSCFTASTSDSLDRLVAAVRLKQAEPREAYDTKIYFIIVDTLQKKPDEYEYAIVVSDAGTINPEVILTNDASLVKEKSASFIKENIIFKKVNTGETIKGLVETIFKTNIRINWRREGNKKVNS